MLKKNNKKKVNGNNIDIVVIKYEIMIEYDVM
jgi:hypothetical protein